MSKGYFYLKCFLKRIKIFFDHMNRIKYLKIIIIIIKNIIIGLSGFFKDLVFSCV